MKKKYEKYINDNSDELFPTSLKEETDYFYENQMYLLEKSMELLNISEEDLENKDEFWIKSKIREFKLKIINS